MKITLRLMVTILLVCGLLMTCMSIGWADGLPKIKLSADGRSSNTQITVNGAHLTIDCRVENEWGTDPDPYFWKLDGKQVGSGKAWPITVTESEDKQQDFTISCTRSGKTVEAIVTVEKAIIEKSLQVAISQGSVKRMEEIIETHKQLLNKIDKSFRTPLHYASDYNRTKCVESLIKLGADLNIRDINGQTPLSLAVQGKSVDSMQALINAGASISLPDNQGNSPLIYAVKNADVTLVNALIKAGAPVNARNHGWKTPLHWAVLADSRDVAVDVQAQIVQALLTAGANPSLIENSNGLTPLHTALFNKDQAQIIKLLISAHGIDMQAEDFQGNGYIHYAVGCGYDIEILTELIKNGCKPNKGNNLGLTPLHQAAYTSKEMIDYLLNAGVDIEIPSRLNATPLYIAVLNGEKEIAKLLIEKGAKIPVVLKDGNTMLHAAAESADIDIMKQGLEKGLDINQQNTSKETPLYLAVVANNAPVVEYLLSQQAIDTELPDSEGHTPLYIAVQNQYNQIAKFLIAKKANVNFVDDRGISLLQLTEQMRNTELENELRKAGAK